MRGADRGPSEGQPALPAPGASPEETSLPPQPPTGPGEGGAAGQSLGGPEGLRTPPSPGGAQLGRPGRAGPPPPQPCSAPRPASPTRGQQRAPRAGPASRAWAGWRGLLLRLSGSHPRDRPPVPPTPRTRSLTASLDSVHPFVWAGNAGPGVLGHLSGSTGPQRAGFSEPWFSPLGDAATGGVQRA